MAKRVTKGNLWGFIQSRPYVSLADIRRLFSMEVEGAAAIHTSEGVTYVGLPPEVADLVRQLWQEGRIAFDLNYDVHARVVQGIYPARVPLGRQHHSAGGGEGQADADDNATGAQKRRRRRKRRSAEAGAVASAE